MKKIVLTLLVLLCTIPSFAEDKLNPTQVALRTAISNYLSEQGYGPSIDGDGDLKFKKDDLTYYVEFDSEETDPLFVTVYLGYNYDDTFTKEKVTAQANSINLYKCVKLVLRESSYSFQSQMFLTKASRFIYVFPTIMDNIKSARKELAESVGSSGGGSSSSSATSSMPFTVTSVQAGNVSKDGTIITSYGGTIYDTTTRYLSPKLFLSNVTAGTYTLYVKLYKNGELQTVASSPDGYTYSSDVTVTASSSSTILAGWGSDTAGRWSMGNYAFEIWYNGTCLGVCHFKVN